MSLSPTDLRLDWCSNEAATYALKQWYARPEMPMGKRARIGVWERGHFRGVLIFGPGAVAAIGHPYGLTQFQCTQLLRLALHPQHESDLSRVLAIACRMIHKAYPGLRLIVTFAEADRYTGSVYQAAGWQYTGIVRGQREFVANGRRYHGRAFRQTFGNGHSHDEGVSIVFGPDKHRYLFPLDAEMAARIASLAKPYPKRVSSIDSDAPACPAGEGGAIPTDTLQPLTSQTTATR